MGYDGTIRIDTSVDSKGFNAGIKGITGGLGAVTASLGKMAAAVGIAFGLGALASFGKSAVDAASEMAAAMTGLQSVVLGTGKSFAQAKAFINDYIKDGLVPATNAMTAYKNLAARGYDTQQIEQVLKALKDSAAFGRQASLSMGQAIQGATEGLKNENSVLVDNAGVTKNVSVMWKEYAESIGTTADKLTKAQKIQAEVNGILQETRFQTGDAAKLSGQFGGKMAAVAASFVNFKVAVGNTIIPIVTKILPLIQAALDKLTIFFNKASQIMSALFGVEIGAGVAGMEQVADNTQDAAAAQDDLAKATTKAGKAAKGALAAFDELNVLQRMEEDQQAVPETAGATMPVEIEPVVAEELSPETLAVVDQIRNKLAELFAPLQEPLQKLQDTLAPMWTWLVDEVWTPLSGWVMNEVAPRFFELLGGALDQLNTVLVALQPAWQWFWENVLQPAFEWAGNKIIESLDWLIVKVGELNETIQEHPEKLTEWGDKLNDVSNGLLIMQGPMGWITIMLKNLAANIAEFGFSWDAVKGFVSDAWEKVKEIWAPAGAWISTNVIEPIKGWFAHLWMKVKQFASEAWKFIVEAWQGAGDWFNTNVVEPVKGWFEKLPEKIGQFFSDAWTKVTEIWGGVEKWFQENVTSKVQEAFESISKFASEKWQTAFTGFADVVRNAFNAVIDLMNGALAAFTSGVNMMIAGLNMMHYTVPDYVPLIGGQSWGLSFPTVTAPQIPRLATGAVIPPNSEFAAILGDQRSGRNLEAPEGLIRQIIREEITNIQADVTVNFAGNLAGLVRELRPYIEKETARVGGSLVKGGGLA